MLEIGDGERVEVLSGMLHQHMSDSRRERAVRFLENDLVVRDGLSPRKHPSKEGI